MDEVKPIKIIVEVISSADVKRLEARDDSVRDEVIRLERRLEGLHRTLYELIEIVGGKRGR